MYAYIDSRHNQFYCAKVKTFMFTWLNSKEKNNLKQTSWQTFKCITSSLNMYSGTCLIRHTKGSGKCVGLYRMSEYSGFILVNRTTLGP